jgi:hypothetical protein
VDGRRVGDVEVDLVEERLERREVLVHVGLDAGLGALELEHRRREQQQDRPADPPLDRQRPQDERGPQRLAPQEHRRVLGRPAAVRFAEHVGPAAQAAPGVPHRRRGLQPGPEPRLVRGVGEVPPPRAGAQVPVHGDGGCQIESRAVDSAARRSSGQ